MPLGYPAWACARAKGTPSGDPAATDKTNNRQIDAQSPFVEFSRVAAANQSKKFVSSESERNDMSVNSRNLYDCSDPVQRIFFGLTQYVLNFPLLKMGPLHSAVSYIVHWLKDYLSNQNILFHAYLPCEGIFEIHPYWGLIFWLFFQKFEQLFPNGETFFQKIFWLKSLQMVSSLTGLMCSEIRQP